MENIRLRVFRTVAGERSFRKAAELLHLSQPAVSQQVRALEEELGVRLFDRAGDGVHSVTVTPAGRTLLAYATRAAAVLAEAETALAAIAGEHTGELRLAASTTVAQYILPRMLGAFLADHPQVRPHVTGGNTERVVALVESGDAALGMIEGPPRSRAVRTERFLRDVLVLIVPGKIVPGKNVPGKNVPARGAPGDDGTEDGKAGDDGPGVGDTDAAAPRLSAARSPVRRRRSVTGGPGWATAAAAGVEGLIGLPILMREPGSGTRRVVEQALRRAGLGPGRLRIAMELDSTEAIVSGVEAGLGVGFVSTWAIGKAVRLGTVRPVRVPGLEMERDLSIVWRTGPPPEGAAGAFVRFAVAQGSGLPAAERAGPKS